MKRQYHTCLRAGAIAILLHAATTWAQTPAQLVDYLNNNFAVKVWPQVQDVVRNMIVDETWRQVEDQGLHMNMEDSSFDMRAKPGFTLAGDHLTARFPATGVYVLNASVYKDIPLIWDIRSNLQICIALRGDIGPNGATFALEGLDVDASGAT